MIKKTLVAITPSGKTVKVPQRFTYHIERAHGRLAMLGLLAGGMNEHYALKLPVMQQFVAETGMMPLATAAVVTTVTGLFVLEAMNPKASTVDITPIDVFSDPELLNGRLAMLAFVYVLVAESYGVMVL